MTIAVDFGHKATKQIEFTSYKHVFRIWVEKGVDPDQNQTSVKKKAIERPKSGQPKDTNFVRMPGS